LRRYLDQPGIEEFWAHLSEKIDDLDVIAKSLAELSAPIKVSKADLLDLQGKKRQAAVAALLAL
jgi:hypothetical protein